jgi:transposase
VKGLPVGFSDAREQKARELAERAQITFRDGAWYVPSQSGSGTHRVEIDGLFPNCSCKDHELTGRDCKHILAVRLFVERQRSGKPREELASTEPAPKPKRPTYPQNWPMYNAAQENEKRFACELLADLCKLIEEPPRKRGAGRPPLSLADQVFCAVYKVFTTVSARRFMCDLEAAHEAGFIAKLLSYNASVKGLENPALTPILHAMIRQSALPLKEVETTFAPDSSGFCTSRFIRWYDVKYGVTREMAEWVKVHLMTGVKTNIVTAVEILDKDAADSPQFPKLLDATAKGFKIKEVPADKGYLSVENLEAAEAIGATAYIPFKSNSTGAAGGIFEKAYHYFCLHREEFLKHYHQRSNVESTFSMIKRKFGDAVRSKTDTAMVNEALAKILCHNLCCLVSAWYELGIEAVLSKQDVTLEPRTILKFPGQRA